MFILLNYTPSHNLHFHLKNLYSDDLKLFIINFHIKYISTQTLLDEFYVLRLHSRKGAGKVRRRCMHSLK